MGSLLTLLLPTALLPTAHAGDLRVAYTVSAAGSLTQTAASADERWVAFLDDSVGQLYILDTDSWGFTTTAPCPSEATAADVAVWDGDADGVVRFYVACSDGTLSWTDMIDAGATNAGDDEQVAVGAGAALGVAADDDEVLVIAESADTGANPEVYTVTPSAETPAASYIGDFGSSGYVDAEITGDYLVVAHGSANLSKVDLSAGGISQDSENISFDITDLLPGDDTMVFLAGGDGGVGKFLVGDNDLQIVIDDNASTGPSIATALAAADEGMWVADGGLASFLLYDHTPGTSSLGTEIQAEVAWPESDDTAAEMPGIVEMATISGYTLAGTDAGELWVLTDRPWVDIDSPTSSTLGEGDTLSLTFTADIGGTWTAYLNPDTDGTSLDSGTITAGETATVELEIGESWAEGSNSVRVEVDDGDGAGHDTETVTVDNPPGQVTFSSSNVTFGNGSLRVDFDGLSDTDISTYALYITTTSFSADDWETGGPDFDGDDDLSDLFADEGEYIELSAADEVGVTITPLTNDQTYYLAVRATDEGGLEGPMSNVVTGIPEETFSAAERAGELGGFCSHDGRAGGRAGGAGLLGLLLVGAGALRRRRGAVLGLAALGVGLALPQDAAADDEAESVLETEFPKEASHGFATLTYGPIWMTDENIQSVFGDSGHQMMWFEAGPTFSRVFETAIAAGWLQEMGWLISEDGASSSEHDMLTILAFAANASFRLDFGDKQFLVPFASAGADYWLWRENWVDDTASSGGDSIGGGKWGWHWALGGQLRLNSLEPARASALQARTGIDASYLVVEYRGSEIGEEQTGLLFTNSALGIGIRLDY